MNAQHRRSLRRDFARWMQSELGYAAVRSNDSRGGAAAKGSEIIDLRGETWSREARWLHSASFGLFGAAVVLTNVESLRMPSWVTPNTLLAVSIVLFALGYVIRRATRECTWVRCLERETPLGADQVRKFHDLVEKSAVEQTRRGKPPRVAVVSGAAGFAAGAIELATARHVECYRRAESGFERVA